LGSSDADNPRFAEVITKHAMRPDYDYADEFEFGLDLIVDSLERQRARPDVRQAAALRVTRASPPRSRLSSSGSTARSR
jgi:hypothetical protein